MTGRKIVLEHPAYRSLISAAANLDKVGDSTEQTRTLVDNARACVRSAIEVLMERDELKHELGVVSVMIDESTGYKLEKVDGKLVETVEILDDYIFSFAIKKLKAIRARITR